MVKWCKIVHLECKDEVSETGVRFVFTPLQLLKWITLGKRSKLNEYNTTTINELLLDEMSTDNAIKAVHSFSAFE